LENEIPPVLFQFLVLDDQINETPEWFNVILGDFPENVWIDAMVGVSQQVAEISQLSPGNLLLFVF
jgi:hypothetical protein